MAKDCYEIDFNGDTDDKNNSEKHVEPSTRALDIQDQFSKIVNANKPVRPTFFPQQALTKEQKLELHGLKRDLIELFQDNPNDSALKAMCSSTDENVACNLWMINYSLTDPWACDGRGDGPAKPPVTQTSLIK